MTMADAKLEELGRELTKYKLDWFELTLCGNREQKPVAIHVRLLRSSFLF